MRTDSELLRAYALADDEAAFAELVRRHIGLVYGSAVRLLNGDAALAEDVTQKAFTQLAHNAAELAERESPAGWLHTTTRNLALNAIRAEQRRRAREQEASAMNEQTSAPDLAWAQLRPLIDEAVGHLPELDRNAVLLRFFEDKSHREVGEVLGVGENAARMRIERAVEKLRDYFARHGVTTTVALLATTLGTRAAMSAPAALADTVAAASLSAHAAISGGTPRGWAHSKLLKVGTVAVVLIVLTFLLIKRPPPPPPLPLVPTPAKRETPVQPTVNSAPTSGSVAETAAPVQAMDLPPPEPAPAATPPAPAAPVAIVPEVKAPADNTSPSSHTGLADWGEGRLLGVGKKAQDTDPAINDKGEQKVVNVEGKTYYVPQDADKFVLVDSAGVLKGKTITAVASSAYRRLALCSDGTLVWWGMSDGFPAYAFLGNKPTVEPKVMDTTALNGKKIVALAAGQAASMVLCDDGSVYEWGYHQPRAVLVINPAAGPVVYRQLAEIAKAPARVVEYYDHFTPRYPAGVRWRYDGTPLKGEPRVEPRDKFLQTISQDAPVCMNFGALSGKKVSAISYDNYTGDAVVLCTDGSLVSWGEVVKFREAFQPLCFAGVGANGLPKVLNDRGRLKDKTITAVAGHNVLCADGTVFRWPTLINGEDGIFAGNLALPELKGKKVAKITSGHVLFTDGTLVYWAEQGSPTDPAEAKVLDDLLRNLTIHSRVFTGQAKVVNLSKLGNKKIVDIAGDYGFIMAQCADGTLAWIIGEQVDRIMDMANIPADKSVLAISPYLILFGDKPVEEKVLEASPVKAPPG